MRNWSARSCGSCAAGGHWSDPSQVPALCQDGCVTAAGFQIGSRGEVMTRRPKSPHGKAVPARSGGLPGEGKGGPASWHPQSVEPGGDCPFSYLQLLRGRGRSVRSQQHLLRARGVSPETQQLLLRARGVSPETQQLLLRVRGVSPECQQLLLRVRGVSPESQQLLLRVRGLSPECQQLLLRAGGLSPSSQQLWVPERGGCLPCGDEYFKGRAPRLRRSRTRPSRLLFSPSPCPPIPSAHASELG